jgi:hypothetical protein
MQTAWPYRPIGPGSTGTLVHSWVPAKRKSCLPLHKSFQANCARTEIKDVESLILRVVLLDFRISTPNEHDPICDCAGVADSGHRRIPFGLDEHGRAISDVHAPQVVPDRLVHQTAEQEHVPRVRREGGHRQAVARER